MVRMVVTDLDGTLLSSNSDYSAKNLSILHDLGTRGVIRVIATGRSPYSADKVIPNNFPIDYLIFSSGAGIIRWSDKSIVYANELNAIKVQGIIDVLVNQNVDFMVHEPIPQNHIFHYYFSGSSNPDFDRRLSVYKDFSSPLILGVPYPDSATQIIAVLPPKPELFYSLEGKLSGVKIIRATSPLDGESIWMEVFPEGISKGHSVDWLCKFLGNIQPNEILAIGNDYNDLDLLNYSTNSYLVANAPDELKSKFNVVASNDESGFAEAVEKVISQ